jgi:pimeloyl-ACP methyl ester carboxylesterase
MEVTRHAPHTLYRTTSADGTCIAFERVGDGPPLILVDGALCSRAFGPMPKLAPLLAKHFTVFVYDRRGRGDSGDTKPYAREREIEDLAALLREAGGSAIVVGLSSGGALALEAAASGLDIEKLVVYEPPFMFDDGHHARANHEGRLREILAAGHRGDAVTYFMRDMVGVPAPFAFMMRLMPRTWRKLKAVAHTLPYDAAIMGDFSLPRARLASIRIPTIAMNGEKTDAKLETAARAVAETVPGAEHHVLPGQSHDVKPEVLSEALTRLLVRPRSN